MPTYVYECQKCKERVDIVCSIKDYENIKYNCCGERAIQVILPVGFKFSFTSGKETGLYDYDYGKKATWDLTPPGKMDRLKKDGVIRNPFDDAPKADPPTREDIETFG